MRITYVSLYKHELAGGILYKDVWPARMMKDQSGVAFEHLSPAIDHQSALPVNDQSGIIVCQADELEK